MDNDNVNEENKNWIKMSIKKKGALTELAQKEGGIDQKTGRIKISWLKKKLKSFKTIFL